jgi:hypothetical protein
MESIDPHEEPELSADVLQRELSLGFIREEFLAYRAICQSGVDLYPPKEVSEETSFSPRGIFAKIGTVFTARIEERRRENVRELERLHEVYDAFESGNIEPALAFYAENLQHQISSPPTHVTYGNNREEKRMYCERLQTKINEVAVLDTEKAGDLEKRLAHLKKIYKVEKR